MSENEANFLTEYVENRTRTMGDEEYLETLECLIDNLQMSVDAKKEEQRNAEVVDDRDGEE